MFKKAIARYLEMNSATLDTIKNWKSKEPYHGLAKASALLWIAAHFLTLSAILQVVALALK